MKLSQRTFSRKKNYFITLSVVVIILLSVSSSLYAWIWNDILISGGPADQISPQIAYSGQGNFLLVWEERTNDASDIYGLIQIGGQQQQSSPFPICTAPADQRSPVAVWDGTNYLVVWEDDRGGNFDIYASRISSTGQVLDNSSAQGSGLPICSAVNDQLRPAVVWNGQNYLVVWEDHRGNLPLIYAMRVSREFQLLDGFADNGGLLVSGGATTSGATTSGEASLNPDAAWNGSNYFVAWESHLGSSSDIYACRISPAGQLLTSPHITESEGVDELNPSVVSDGKDFMLVWDVHTPGNYADVAGILVSADGLPDRRGPFAVAEAQQDQLMPLAIWCENHYLVLWKDSRNGKADIYLVRLSSAGNFLDAQNKTAGISLGIVGSSRLDSPPAAVWDETAGEYIIIWEENQSDNFDLYDQHYKSVAPPVLSWTGEPNYQDDGVNPDNGSAGTTTGASNGTSFEFRVKYQNASGLPPQKAQLWIDQDDDGIYSINPANPLMDKIMNMTRASGSDYTQGVIYKAVTTLQYAGDGKINYQFVFGDLSNEATGEPAKNHQVSLINSPASLTWINTTGYESDGVSPDSGTGGTSFTFMVKYLDLEDDPPSSTEVWIDLNRDNVYEQNEKFAMIASDDRSFAEGCDYQKSISVLYVPDLNSSGEVNIKYRFNFFSGAELVEGEPANDHFFSVTPYLSVPVLSWSSEAGFTQGVRLAEETPGGGYEFQVSYQDADNDPADSSQVWIDENRDGHFTQEEKHDLEELTSSDHNVVDGKLYHLLIHIPYSGGNLSYKFVFSDGKNMAEGEPFFTGAQIKLSSPVYLSWSGEPGYAQDGVEPDSGPPQAIFQFQVKYISMNNFPPGTKQVWLDENNDSQYQESEKYDMQELDPLDLDYSNGKIYAVSLPINPPSVPVSLAYKFVFQDIYMEEAAGEPAGDSLNVLLSNAQPDPNIPQDPNTVTWNQDPNSPTTQDPNSPADPSNSYNGYVPQDYTPHELKSSQGGCFILSLLSP